MKNIFFTEKIMLFDDLWIWYYIYIFCVNLISQNFYKFWDEQKKGNETKWHCYERNDEIVFEIQL